MRHERLRRLPGSEMIVDPFLAFPVLWVLGALLAWWDPIDASRARWTPTVLVVMVAVPAAFALAGLLVRTALTLHDEKRGVASPPAANRLPASRAAARTLLVIGVIAGLAELAYQFHAAGGVPLLSSSIDKTRVAQPGGPAVGLIDLLTVAIICGIALPERLWSREAVPDLAIAAVATLGFALAGGRGSAVLGLMAAIIARGLLHGFPRRRVLAAAALIGFVAVSAVFFARTSQNRANPFEKQLYEQVLPDLPLPARAYVPFHYGLATNFDVLAAIVGEFPASTPHHFGLYSASGFDLLIPGTASLSTVTARLTGPFVTSTAAGPYWADGGLVLVVLGIAVIGAASSGIYALATRRRTPATALVAGHLTTMAIFGVYTNLFTDHPDWVIILPGVAVVGLVHGSRTALPSPPVGAGDFVRRYAPQLAVQGVEGVRRTLSGALPTRHSLSLTRRNIVIPAVLLVALAVAAVAIQASSDPKPIPPKAAAALPVADRFKLPRDAVGRGVTYATDGDNLDDNAPLWALRRRGATTKIVELTFESDTPATRRFSVPARRASKDRVLDVGTWPTGDAVVEMSLLPAGVRTRVLSVRGKRRVQSIGFSRLEAPSVRRDVAIATWEGTSPDLFVIDRGGPRERVRVTVWSGESGFNTKVADLRVPLRDLDPGRWLMEVSRLTGKRPDLAALSLRGTGSRHPEAQVLEGDRDFSVFAVQGALDLAPRRAAPDGYAAGSAVGKPSLYLIDGSSLITIPVAAAGP